MNSADPQRLRANVNWVGTKSATPQDSQPVGRAEGARGLLWDDVSGDPTNSAYPQRPMGKRKLCRVELHLKRWLAVLVAASWTAVAPRATRESMVVQVC
jgi:hypothetical protein